MSVFICIEGIDAAGKTSVSQALAQALGASYYKSPGGPYAEARKIVDEVVDPLTRYFFYRAAVQYDSGAIRNLLKNTSVVCDRYIYSTIVCHAAMDERIQRLFEVTGLVMPDHVFVLTADEDVRVKRLVERPTVSTVEHNLALQRKIDKLFRAQGHPVIDTTHTRVEDVVDIILKQLKEGERK